MKIMKFQFRSIITYLTGLLLIMLMGSCKKYLQVQPRDSMFEEEAFSTQEGTHAVLNGIYQSLSDSLLYGNVLSFNVTEVLAQYYFALLSEHSFLRNHNYAMHEQLFNSIWDKAYSGVLGANKFCQQLEAPSYKVLPAGERDILLGEAYAIRALLQFDLLRLFGPIYSKHPESIAIPYMSKISTEIQPFLPASTVMANVLKDLNAALLLLEKDPVRTSGVNRNTTTAVGDPNNYMTNRHFRMNYFAVKALLSRALLYAGDTEKAWLAVEGLIAEQAAFFPWQMSQEMAGDPLLSRESLFGISNRKLYDYYRRMFSPLLQSDRIFYPQSAVLDATYGTTAPDQRLQHWFKVGVEGDKNYRVFVKFSDATVNDAAIRYYQPIIRKSEPYLIAAETAPDLEQGYSFLNTLRLTRGLLPLSSVGSSRSQLLTAIVDEYRREFIGEGQTFFTYKRLGLSAIPHNSGIGSLLMPDQNYIVPIPKNELRYR